MTTAGIDWLLRASRCPACGRGAVSNFNTHPDTRKQSFWRSDRQVVTCEKCARMLIRNGAYGAPLAQAAWKIKRDCPCGRPWHEYNDVCEYMAGEG